MKFDGNLIVLNLKHLYHENGIFSFKIVLNPDVFEHSHGSEVYMTDPYGDDLDFNVHRWGRKMNCEFEINEETPTGVALVELKLVSSKKEYKEILDFWIV